MEAETLRFIESWIILGIERYHHLVYEDKYYLEDTA
jgi:hypothetical protein